MTIFYRLGQKLYVNITNKCPCNCTFCIRKFTDSVGDAKSLWLEREPTLDEIKAAFKSRQDLQEISEIVFCGYGEPMERAEDVIEICKFMKSLKIPIRINTNGLVRLINPAFDISALSAADSISISLNADDAEEYNRLTNPKFGIESYTEMLNFAKLASKHTAVTLTVVDALSPERIENCHRIAESLNLSLMVRSFM